MGSAGHLRDELGGLPRGGCWVCPSVDRFLHHGGASKLSSLSPPWRLQVEDSLAAEDGDAGRPSDWRPRLYVSAPAPVGMSVCPPTMSGPYPPDTSIPCSRIGPKRTPKSAVGATRKPSHAFDSGGGADPS